MKVLLAPFTFIISFIKHFFIGVKFVFFDAWYNLIEYYQDKNNFKKREQHTNLNEIIENNNDNEEEEQHVLSLDERNRIQLEKQELMKEMQREINSRKVSKDYYYYYGTDKTGKKVKGIMSATNKMTLHNFLANEGIDVYQVKKAGMANFLKKIGLEQEHEMSTKDLIFWLTQVCTYLKAGLTLNDTIHIMMEQASKDKKKKRLYEAISYELTLGESFSKALENQGKVFPPLLINMIRSAEATGEIIKTLDDMASYYKTADSNRKQIISALTYPSVVLVISVVVLAFLLIFVVPKFESIYSQLGSDLPGITKALIAASNFLQNNIIKVVLVLAAIIVILIAMYKNIKRFRFAVQFLIMHIPVIKDIIIYKEVIMFTKTFSSLVKHDVFITDSIEMLGKITGNEIYKNIIKEAVTNLSAGEGLSRAFENKWAFPRIAYEMLVTGEKTGRLGPMMENVANYYEEEQKNLVQRLKSLVEPVMIVMLALIVGIILLSILIPMFSMYSEVL